MHSVDLANLASVYINQVNAMMAFDYRPRHEAVHAIWLTNRFRQEAWTGRLAAHRDAINSNGVSYRSQRWHEIIPVMQEVLIAEPLTRCLAYHASLLEHEKNDSDFATLMESALQTHIEARNRCLHLIVFGQGLSVEHAVHLNRIRRAMEDFNDQLLAIARPLDFMDRYAFDSVVVAKQQSLLANATKQQMHIHTAGLAEHLQNELLPHVDPRVANARLNYRFSQGVLELFPTELFDEFGVAKSSWLAKFQAESEESTGGSEDITADLAYPLNVLFGPSRKEPILEKSKERRW